MYCPDCKADYWPDQHACPTCGAALKPGFASRPFSDAGEPLPSRRQLGTLGAAGYATVVLVLSVLAFGISDGINGGWLLVLIAATLPWSVISVLFAWPLAHGTVPPELVLLFVVFGGVNGYMLGLSAAAEQVRG
jgi:hypothetical protein